jgi:hypothetical protein
MNIITHEWDSQHIDFISVIEKRPFDMIHIDADHKPESVRKDFDNLWPLLAPGGVMIIDDMRSLACERCVPLIFHIIPWIMDHWSVRCWTFVNNYNCQLLVEKML